MSNLSRRTVVYAASVLPFTMLVGRTASAQVADRDAFAVLASDPRFGNWLSLVLESGLSPNLRGSARFTVFVPTNQAFDAKPDLLVSLLPNASEAFPDSTRLIRFIRSHVLAGMHPLAEFSGKEVTVTSL